jgi:hypothetical protein
LDFPFGFVGLHFVRLKDTPPPKHHTWGEKLGIEFFKRFKIITMKHYTLTGCNRHCYAPQFFVRVCISMFFLITIFHFEGKAQGARPSCNISGPLTASVSSGHDIVIEVEVANSTAKPELEYKFISNSSGASIKKKGPVVYNAAKNSSTQQLSINPGSNGSEFNLRLKVITKNGTCECSKSVSVSQ